MARWLTLVKVMVVVVVLEKGGRSEKKSGTAAISCLQICKGFGSQSFQAAHMHCKVTFTGIFSSGGSDNKIYNSELSEVL